MSKEPLFVAVSNQKGGVGKSALTVVLASYFHFEKNLNVAIIDCDSPQHSLVPITSNYCNNNGNAYKRKHIPLSDPPQKRRGRLRTNLLQTEIMT